MALYRHKTATRFKSVNSCVEVSSQWAVKLAPLNWVLTDIAYLLHFEIHSANFIPLIAWTTYSKKGRVMAAYAMPAGEQVNSSTVFTTKQMLSLMRQQVETLLLLHHAGVAHADLKPENFIYLRSVERYVAIDLGMCRGIVQSSEGPSLQGVAYTLPFRDFHFYDSINPLSCEIFALGQGWRCLATRQAHIYDTSVETERLTAEVARTLSGEAGQCALIADLITECLNPLETRASLHEVGRRLDLRLPQRLTFNDPSTALIPAVTHCDPPCGWYEVIHWWLFEESTRIRLELRCFYLALTNVHRCRELYSTELELRIVFALNVYLASNVIRADFVSQLEELRLGPKMQETLDALTIQRWLPKILNKLNCRVYIGTAWTVSSSLRKIYTSLQNLCDHRHVVDLTLPTTSANRQLITEISRVVSTLRPLSVQGLREACSSFNTPRGRGFQSKRPWATFNLSSSFSEVESPTLRLCFEQAYRCRDLEAVIADFFNPKEDVGFVAYFRDFIQQNPKLEAAVLQRILPLGPVLLSRYSALVDLTRLAQLRRHSSEEIVQVIEQQGSLLW